MQKTEFLITDEQVDALIELCNWRLYLVDENVDNYTDRELILEAYETLVAFRDAMWGNE